MAKNNNPIHNPNEPIAISIDCNPIVSKGILFGVLGHFSPQKITSLCIQELINGTNFNELDMPFYAAACEVLKNLIVGKLSDNEKEIYNKILKHSNIISVDAAELRKQTKDINKSNCTPKSKEDTVETTDASEDITETDNKED